MAGDSQVASLCMLPTLQVVYGHLDDPETQDIQRGVSYLRLRPGAPHCCLVSPTPPLPCGLPTRGAPAVWPRLFHLPLESATCHLPG